MKRFVFRKLTVCGLCAALLAGTLYSSLGNMASAQDVLRIAAVVNDRVISALDVVNRLRFVIWSTGVPNTPENRRRLSAQILHNLIDEELRSQEAERQNVSISEADVDGAFTDIAKRNDMSAEQLSEILRRDGVAESTLRRQLRAQIAWGRTVSRRLRREAQVSDDEIDAEIDRIESLRNKPRYRVSEIFLSVDDPEQEERVRLAAMRLVDQIRNGADFSALASAFSQSTSAAQGGDLGWIQAGRLSQELDKALQKLEVGQLAGPIRTLPGYHILLLRDQREPDGKDEGDTVIDLHQIVLPPTGGDGAGLQDALAGDIRASLSGCADLDKVTEKIGTKESGPIGKMKIRDLPPQIRKAVAGLKIGEPSEAVKSAAGRTIILMVCNRTEPKRKKLSRRAVRRQLQQNRAELVARRYLRDLRRSAFIDLRG